MNLGGGPSNGGTRPYSGYHNRPAPAAPDPLTAVGRGTPGGEYLRRFWHPFLLSSELGDLPVAVRILGEDLVAFRDGSGRLGLLHKHCIHRGASLEFGIIVERGIRCCYHGWLYDVDGTVLETPAEPPASPLKHELCQGAYPVRESHGLIFAYLGPPEAMPELPVYDTFTQRSDSRIVPFKLSYPCNWVQIVENAADPIHNAYLHAIVAGQQFSTAFNVLPALDYVETPLGFLSMASRRVKDAIFLRASDIIMPNIGQFLSGANPGTEECFGIACYITRWVTPLDDRNSFYLGAAIINDYTSKHRKFRPEEFGVDKMALIGQTPDRPYQERQREPGDYDAVSSQGSIQNRKSEHLGTTDRGVVIFRRMLARGIRAVEAGEDLVVPRRYAANPVRTYCHEVVLRLPTQANIADLSSIGAFGRRAAEIVIETDQIEPRERERVAEHRIRQLLATELVG
jgi:nitrite reductase/ring-hydroxylating ferredoxin subunit